VIPKQVPASVGGKSDKIGETMGRWSEPWYYDGAFDELQATPAFKTDQTTIVAVRCSAWMSRPRIDHVVACVNALAGLNPAKLGELIKRAEAVVNATHNLDLDRAVDGLEKALADIREGG